MSSSETLGRCCYGGFKPKSACASCAAWPVGGELRTSKDRLTPEKLEEYRGLLPMGRFIGVGGDALRALLDEIQACWDERNAPETFVRLRECGDAVECDMRITIASDTDVKVSDCFRAIDDALTAVTERHDVVLTVECITGSAVRPELKANEGQS